MEEELYNRTNGSVIDLDVNSNDTFIYFPCESDGATFFDIFVSFSYITIMVVSLVGNGIVCYLVQWAPKFQSVTNLFISNLSVGDILLTLFCVPFSFISVLILQHWPFGSELCRTVSYFQAVSVFVSAYTLVAISLDRYLRIMHPFRPRMTKRQSSLIIATVWLIALLTALPIGLVSQMMQPAKANLYIECGLYICTEVWNDSNIHFLYSVVLLVLQYAVPFVALVITYTLIAVVVWGKETPGEAENLRDARIASRKRKMIKMMVTVVIVFTICWLPYNVLLIAMERYEQLTQWDGIKYLYFAFHWLAMSHSCYNPIIYVYMNNRYKAGFISVLSKVPCVRHILPPINYDMRGTSFAMTGLDHDHDSSIRRVHTVTTYVASSRSKNGHSKSSLLVRGNPSIRLSAPEI